MKKIKLVLLKLLGEQKYLSFVSASFQRLYPTGRLGKTYQDIYFLKKFIRKGDTCVDIGAHLGYYTFQMSRLVGKEGKVIAVEPVSKFNKVLESMMASKQVRNIILHKVALGGEGKEVEIGIPRINKEKKFGYARIRKLSEYLEYAESETVPNMNGDELLANLDRVDFIKCDVEGAEVPVFRSLMDTLAKHLPVLLLELADKNERLKMMEMLAHHKYTIYFLIDKKLKQIEPNSDESPISHNHYFIPPTRLPLFSGIISV
ncbi:MAG TPA: FkbM family methyltransferase [Chitinophagaceae bacterium]|nr:FkbM family methyltransferase [Chitinophagaceae bacterium]